VASFLCVLLFLIWCECRGVIESKLSGFKVSWCTSIRHFGDELSLMPSICNVIYAQTHITVGLGFLLHSTQSNL